MIDNNESEETSPAQEALDAVERVLKPGPGDMVTFPRASENRKMVDYVMYLEQGFEFNGVHWAFHSKVEGETDTLYIYTGRHTKYVFGFVGTVEDGRPVIKYVGQLKTRTRRTMTEYSYEAAAHISKTEVDVYDFGYGVTYGPHGLEGLT